MKVIIQNPAEGMSLDFVAKAAGGLLITEGMNAVPVIKYVCTDSREADADTMFCAIRGERVDGHAYMGNTQGAGCVAFLCERVPDNLTPPFAAVVVPDTVAALSLVARAYREAYLPHLTPVAVTGSVGKTTTKECVAAVLAQKGEYFKKEGNFNSVIGLPLSVLEIPQNCQHAVLEMGMSGFGEISAMTNAVHPHIAMVTNVGHAHLEMLGSREGIARAKLEIAESMGAGDILLVNGDEPLLDDEALAPARERGIRVVRLCFEGSDRSYIPEVLVFSVRSDAGEMTFDLCVEDEVWMGLKIPAAGYHMVWAAAFAAVTGYYLGMTEAQVKAGLASYIPAAMRQNVYSLGGVTVIEDCYNASPESMMAAFSVLDITAKSRMIAVLGDMKELGKESDKLHVEVGHAFGDCPGGARGREAYLITVGELGRRIADGAIYNRVPMENILVCEGDKPYAEVTEHLKSFLREGDTLLFKASRSMGLESILNALKAEWNEHA